MKFRPTGRTDDDAFGPVDEHEVPVQIVRAADVVFEIGIVLSAFLALALSVVLTLQSLGIITGR
jgi:hypothetical protein